MAIRYQCETCQDHVESYYSAERDAYEPPVGWLNCERVERVGDEVHSRVKHFCSTACLLSYYEASVRE